MWLCAALCALLAAGCATPDNAPSAEAKAALAPTGKLRVAFLAVPIYAAKDAASGRYRGVAVDLGDSLAAKLGVAVEAMPHTTVSSLIAGAKANAFDVVLMGINAERAAVIDFSAPYMEVEQGVLVRSGVQVGKLEDIDRAGLRIGVLEKAGADVALSRRIKTAELVRAPSVDQLFALLAAGKVDMVAGTSSRLMEEQAKLPGSRMLDGRVTVEPIGMGVPKGRNPAAAQYVGQFVEEAKASGLVARSIGESRLAGVAVAPPK
jgi:polar amino acid transport system substrate-binding protein